MVRSDAIEVEILSHFRNVGRRDQSYLIRKSVDQSMSTENVDYARDSLRVNVDAFHGFSRENRPPIRPCNGKPLRDITLRFFRGERGGPAAYGDSLSKLSQL